MGVLWPPEGEIWLLVTTGGEFGPESELLFEASTAKTKAPESVINIRITWKKWNKMNNLIRIAITEICLDKKLRKNPQYMRQTTTPLLTLIEKLIRSKTKILFYVRNWPCVIISVPNSIRK